MTEAGICFLPDVDVGTAVLPNGGEDGVSIRHLKRLLQEALAWAAEVVDADFSGIVQPEPGGASLRLTLFGREEGNSNQLVPAGEKAFAPARTMAGHAWSTRNVVITPDLAIDSRFSDPTLAELGVKSGVLLPVLVGEQPKFLLGLFSARRREVPLDELHFLDRLMRSTGELIDLLGPGGLQAGLTPVGTDTPATTTTILATESQDIDARRAPRRPYRYLQQIAPMANDGRIPEPEEFFDAQCADISASGFSLQLDFEPKFSNLVVALGQPPVVSYFLARVVRIQKDFRGTRRRYKVGCEFVDRVYL